MKLNKVDNQLFESIKQIVEKAREHAFKTNNAILLKMYWEIGMQIIENKQDGNTKAQYGKSTLKELAKKLTLVLGKGFDDRNLNNMRAFYLAFPIWNAIDTKLRWTHYRALARIDNEGTRYQYVKLCSSENWNTRDLERNIKTNYLGRMLKAPNENDNKDPAHFFKDPYILEFLNIPKGAAYNEYNLETSLISHLKSFLMEMGRGFAFVERQYHIKTDISDFYIDLVFYNYILKCFVLVDLKTDKLSPGDIAQMDMYVRMFDDLVANKDDNPTIGLVLCTEKDETIVKYSVMEENKKLFASKYRLVLPDEQQLKELIEMDRQIVEEAQATYLRTYKK
ncbi:MAG: PDDEXK nuclease domain-containing protein [Bacteroidia bacterium]